MGYTFSLGVTKAKTLIWALMGFPFINTTTYKTAGLYLPDINNDIINDNGKGNVNGDKMFQIIYQINYICVSNISKSEYANVSWH